MIKLERALPALSLLAGWYCLVAGVAVVLFQSVVCNVGALLSSFPFSIGVPLEGLRIGCGVTGVSSFLGNLRFRVSWGICGSARLSSLIHRL